MRPSVRSNRNHVPGPSGGPASRRPPGLVPHPMRVGLLALLGTVLLLASGCGSDSVPAGETINLTIPAGTTKLVESGGTSKAVPEKIRGRVGDTLVVDNRDSSTQFIAGYSVSPGQTLKIPLNRAGSYITNCSAHKDRSIEMEIKE